jgi:hypothetical protein
MRRGCWNGVSNRVDDDDRDTHCGELMSDDADFGTEPSDVCDTAKRGGEMMNPSSLRRAGAKR